MHGKTTTTSMVAAVLAAGGLDPTVVVGGRVDALGSNARLGKSQYLVAEADESDRSFLRLSPIIAVVTNIDREHMDCYRDMEDVEDAFIQFMERVPFYGVVIACNSDERLRALLPRVPRRILTYGTDEDSDFRIRPQEPRQKKQSTHGEARPYSVFEIEYRKKTLGEFELHVPGTHNVLNAAAAVAAGIGLDVSPEHIRAGLAQFRGVDRRFQLRGQVRNVSVVDDYGHHPTEIRATLAAARQCGYRKLHVIFQPHRYTRTRDLADDFVTAFDHADTLQVLDIYAASEAPIEGVSAAMLVERMKANRNSVRYAESFAEAARYAAAEARAGDLVLTLGAGSVSQLGPLVLEMLEQRSAA